MTYSISMSAGSEPSGIRSGPSTQPIVCPLNESRWIALCERLRVPDSSGRFGQLCRAYGEAHRHYHTAEHIIDCLAVFDQAPVDSPRRDEVEFAIWLHDIVYDPRRKDSEERSATIAVGWLPSEPARVTAHVRKLIVATRHDTPPDTVEEALIQDVDLHILGADPEVFDRYEEGVRMEYARVPALLFRRARREILADFLRREHLFHTPWFRTRFEARARVNLERSLRDL